MMEHITIIIIIILITSLWAFIQMGIDKHKAKKNLWRIPEKVLFLPVILGGGIGGMLGMYAFRHKTKHWYFKWGFPIITIIEYALLVWVLFF